MVSATCFHAICARKCLVSKLLFLLTLLGRGQLGLGAHSTRRGIAALCVITKGMFPGGWGHNRRQKIPKSLARP